MGIRRPVRLRGLSPRVRGNPYQSKLAVEYRLPGSIPAVCGGTRNPSPVNRLKSGLSPRVRGNLLQLQEPEIIAGSIPACAGEPYRD